MSKKHQSSRRRAYGRRQHEIHEREHRRHLPERTTIDLESWGPTAQSDPLAFLDPRTPRLRYLPGD